MGLQVEIKLKNTEESNINAMNLKLKELGFKRSNFLSKASLKAWAKHDKKTVKELKKIWTVDTTIGMLRFDIGFSRTSVTQMRKAVRFIVENNESIEFIDNGHDLFERSELKSETTKAILNSLEEQDEEPELLPIDQQTKSDLQSGQFLCKSFSINPFWVLFGKVDTPKFMIKRIYVDDLYNSLYRDKNGLGFMLIPLVTLGANPKFGTQTRDEFFTQAWNMGLREHPNFFFSFIYGFGFADSKNFKPEKFKEMAKEFVEHYTNDEIVERYKAVEGRLEAYKYSYNTAQGRFIGYSSMAEEKLDLLTILKVAIEINAKALTYQS